MKDDLFQKIHGNMTFFVYSEKMVFLFPTNRKLPLLQKSKDDLLPKNTLKHDISSFFSALKKMTLILDEMILSF